MDRNTLERLMKNSESDLVEKKATISDSKNIKQTICAFANDISNHNQPGLIFIGVNDDGSCSDIAINDSLLKKISSYRSEGNILPIPRIEVRTETLNTCTVALIIVHPSQDTPVRYSGRIYVRIGPTTQIASDEEERRLIEKRKSKDLPYDLHEVSSASLDDLDLDLFHKTIMPHSIASDVIEKNSRTIEQQLASLRFVVSSNSPIPTVTGVLTLAHSPREFIPAAYIQFLRIDGEELGDPIKDTEEIEGHLLQMLIRVNDKVKAHINTSVDIKSGPTEIRKNDYPLSALQQLIYNAVLHRSYEGTHAPVKIYWFNDRIEIHSPGGPYGNVTVQNFGTPGITDYRNPHIAEVLKNLGYVQKFGVGIPTANKELEENGNGPVQFQPIQSNILAIVQNRVDLKR